MTTIKRKANSVQMNSNDHRGAKGGLRRLRRPRFLITAAALACVAALPFAAGAAANRPSLGKPNALQNFELRLDVPRTTAAGLGGSPFSRTPSFAWAPVRGATRYEFELSTSKNFGADNSVIWSSKSLKTPATAVPIALPWITGADNSLYWHVRAFGASGSFSPWSNPQGFSMRWAGVPTKLPSAPGYIRWTPVAGATSYDVWFRNLEGSDDSRIGKIVSTITTVADEREYYTLRAPSQNVEWRVRARRDVYGRAQNGLPRVSNGPWSAVYTTVAGASSQPTDAQPAKPLMTVSAQYVSDDGSVHAHALMPAFVFSHDNYDLHRVYIATDTDCVNIVHVGSVVGGTVYAPRVSGPLALAPEQWGGAHSFLLDGSQGKAIRMDGQSATANETLPQAASSSADGDGATVFVPKGTSVGVTVTGKTSASNEKAQSSPRVDLWDTNWKSGRYYWTVVPVVKRETAKPTASGPNSGSTDPNAKVSADSGKESSTVDFQDVVLPQDACQAGDVQMFQKRSTEPVLSESAAPYVTGLSPAGRMVSAVNSHSRFYGAPLVAWTPSTGATKYDVEWSRTSNPWHAAGRKQTPATSLVLPLTPGTWYYRVRGLNPWLPKNASLRWSGPMRVQIAPPTFSVSGG